MQQPKIVSPTEWLAARKELLVKEKALTRQRDALAEERQQLPWVELTKRYVFDGPNGKRTLADLFEGRSQLVVYHFMFGPDAQEGCPSCSLLADHLDPSVVHLAQRDVSVAVISRARSAQIEAFKRRMGWRFTWVSSFDSDFNADFQVSVTPEQRASGKMLYNFEPLDVPLESPSELPGTSVFFKDESDTIFHTYSAYARSGEPLLNVYNFLDMVPKGRDEGGLPWTTAWLKHHDRYGS